MDIFTKNNDKKQQHRFNVYSLFKVSVTQTMSIDKTRGRNRIL